MRTQCRVCGKFTSHDDYCAKHGKEYPDCKHFECPQGHPEFNICYGNAPHSCRRARAEGECFGYEVGEKVSPPRYGIVNKNTGETLATGHTGLELMEAFSKTDIYKELFSTKKKGGK